MVCVALCCLWSVPALAQQTTADSPNYVVELVGTRIEPSDIIITYTVLNRGAPARSATRAELMDFHTQALLASQDIQALGSGESARYELPLPRAQFPPGTTLNAVLTVGGMTTVDNTVAVIVEIPQTQTQPQPQPSPTTVSPAPEAESEEGFGDWWDDVVLELPLGVTLDLSERKDRFVLSGLLVTGLVIVLLVWAILRVLFRKKPSFGNWQPPYASMPPLDPNSTPGRRQAWQQHAHNNILWIPCLPGVIIPRKVLLGADARYLSGWHILSVRATQYDMYGRVSRTQVLASGKHVHRLDSLAQKCGTMDDKKLAKRVRPVAHALANGLKKRINRRSAMLAIALDVRFKGIHGEVRIVFELYECQNGQPRLLDHWEPEMIVMSKTIYESYTFTVHGQHNDETYRAFRKRLQQDIERVLVNLLRLTRVTPPKAFQASPAPAPKTPVSLPPVLPEEGMFDETVQSDAAALLGVEKDEKAMSLPDSGGETVRSCYQPPKSGDMPADDDADDKTPDNTI